MFTPPCTDADDLLHCSATVGNLGERKESDILDIFVAWRKCIRKPLGLPYRRPTSILIVH